MTNVATDTNAAVTKATTTDLPMVYVNGQMLPKSQAAVNVFDHGLLYGDGVFEGIRVYKGKIFKSAQHMRRLYACAKAIRLDLEKHVTPDEMVKIQRFHPSPTDGEAGNAEGASQTQEMEARIASQKV